VRVFNELINWITFEQTASGINAGHIQLLNTFGESFEVATFFDFFLLLVVVRGFINNGNGFVRNHGEQMNLGMLPLRKIFAIEQRLLAFN
jgi:hypothetical protein